MNNINSQESSRLALAAGKVSAVEATATANKPIATGKKAPVGQEETSSVKTAEQTKQVVAQSDRVEKAVAQLNDYVQSLQRDLRFSVDEELGRAVVSVIDRNSQEVIRQIPNETALELARNLKDQQRQELDIPQEQANIGANLGLINTRI